MAYKLFVHWTSNTTDCLICVNHMQGAISILSSGCPYGGYLHTYNFCLSTFFVVNIVLCLLQSTAIAADTPFFHDCLHYCIMLRLCCKFSEISEILQVCSVHVLFLSVSWLIVSMESFILLTSDDLWWFSWDGQHSMMLLVRAGLTLCNYYWTVVQIPLSETL